MLVEEPGPCGEKDELPVTPTSACCRVEGRLMLGAGVFGGKVCE